MNRVQLFTGGLDSVMLWRFLQHKRKPARLVYVVQPGSPYAGAEQATMRVLETIEPALAVETLQGAEWPDPEPDGHVMHRNLGLIVQVAANTAGECIYLGGVRGESSPDKARCFLRAASCALSTSENHPIKVSCPLRRHTKAWHLQAHIRLHPDDYPLIASTRSCYSPEGRCGECVACFRRWVAFTLAGLPPEDHRTPPWEHPYHDGRTAWRYMTGTSPFEWPGMLDNHRDAVRALRMHAS